MSSSAVSERLRKTLADVFDIPAAEVTPDLIAGAVPAWDSVGHLQAILALETEFGVQFDPDRMAGLTSVRRLQAELESLGVRD